MQRRALTKVSGYLPFLMIFIAVLLWVGCEEEIIPEVDNTIVVMPYNGPRLSPGDSWTYDREEGLIFKWYAYLAGDSVVIERDGLCEESCTEQYQLVLISRGAALPTFRGCAYLKNYSYPVKRTVSDSLVSGEVKIQDWDPAGIVSGRVDGRWRSGDSLGFIFWADVMTEKVELVTSDYQGYQYPLLPPLDYSLIAEPVWNSYLEDAARLTVRIMHDIGGAAASEVEIPEELWATIHDALLYIQTADELAARDSVIDIYKIHTFPIPELHTAVITADSSTAFMQAWKYEIQSSGNIYIDSLLTLYNLTAGNYSVISPKSSMATATVHSTRPLNIPALCDLFEQVDDIYSAQPEEIFGDGPDMDARARENSWNLDFSLGWDNCESECTQHYTWSFRVSYDGYVELVSSSGPLIPSDLD